MNDRNCMVNDRMSLSFTVTDIPHGETCAVYLFSENFVFFNKLVDFFMKICYYIVYGF